MRKLAAALFAMVSLLTALPSAQAWGPRGHQVVAEIAARELTPVARAEVEKLLGDRASPAMREAAPWADDLRDWPGYGNTAPLHYVNYPRGTCDYVARRDCRNGRCIVAALHRFVRELREERDRRKRADALRWVIHLVADAHQPQHAGYADDRGGNDVQLTFRREGTNLHRLLDSGLLRERRQPLMPYVDWLVDHEVRDRLWRGPIDTWTADAPERWTGESCRLLPDVMLPSGSRVSDDYVRRVTPLLEKRLLQAGHRLAMTLNAALDPASVARPRDRSSAPVW